MNYILITGYITQLLVSFYNNRVIKMPDINIETLTPEDVAELKAALKAEKPIIEVRDLVKEICDLPPEKAKDVLCNMAKKAEEKRVHKSGWEKYILDSIKKNM